MKKVIMALAALVFVSQSAAEAKVPSVGQVAAKAKSVVASAAHKALKVAGAVAGAAAKVAGRAVDAAAGATADGLEAAGKVVDTVTE